MAVILKKIISKKGLRKKNGILPEGISRFYKKVKFLFQQFC